MAQRVAEAAIKCTLHKHIMWDRLLLPQAVGMRGNNLWAKEKAIC